MESFIPFGGLFSTSSDFKGPISSPYQGFPRCHQDKGKCEREVADFSNGGFTASMADQYQSCLPMWLQMAEFGTNSKIDLAKVFLLASDYFYVSLFILNFTPRFVWRSFCFSFWTGSSFWVMSDCLTKDEEVTYISF